MRERKFDFSKELDEMHQAVLSVLPEKLLDLTDISVTRAGLDALMSQMPSPELPAQISVEEAQIPGIGADPDVPIRIYKPESLPPNAPGLVWIHGGGMVLGSAEMDDAGSAAIAEQHQCVVISVDYRLAPENPYPAPLHDCYAALKWFAKNANSLGVSSDRIAIGGASAGGGKLSLDPSASAKFF